MAGSTESQDRLSHPFQRYSNPYLDVASQYLPASAKELFDTGRNFYLGNGIVKPIVDKFSEFAVTEFIFKHHSSVICDKWEELLVKKMGIASYSIHAGMNKHALGNHVMSIRFPTRRKFVCDTCLHAQWEDEAKWSYFYPDFHVKCPKCNARTRHTAVDVVVKDLERVSLISWNPEDIFINYSQEMPEKTKYFFKVPPHLVSKIKRGYKHQIEGIPAIYIEAVRRNRLIEINRDNLYHMKMQTISQKDMAWGMPLAVAGFKKIHYNRILNKSQEAIALERANPKDFVWPAATGGLDPIKMYNLPKFGNTVIEQMKRSRRDLNYTAVMPGPIGVARLGGDAKALLLTPEIDQSNKEIAASCDVPLEMIFGGLTWSASSVNMRMLENKFMRHREDIIGMVKWIIETLSPYVGLPIIDVDMAEFKMADDPQQKQMAIQLYSMGLLSAKTMLSQWGWDWKDEAEQRAEEEEFRAKFQEVIAEMQAKIQGKTQIINARYSAEAQFTGEQQMMNAQQEEEYRKLKLRVESLMRQQGNRNPNVDDLVNEIAQLVKSVPMPEIAMRIVDNLRKDSPSVATLVEMKMNESMPPMPPMPMMPQGGPPIGEPGEQPNPFAPVQGGAPSGGGGAQMMNMPQQLPPRRMSA